MNKLLYAPNEIDIIEIMHNINIIDHTNITSISLSVKWLIHKYTNVSIRDVQFLSMQMILFRFISFCESFL